MKKPEIRDQRSEVREDELTPIARAERLYSEHLPMRDFMMDLLLYLRHGTVLSSPQFFAMARPVRKDATIEELADPSQAFESPDAWFICMAVGDLRSLARLLPYRLPFIAFCRKFNNTLKVYDTEAFMPRAQSPSSPGAALRRSAEVLNVGKAAERLENL